MLWWKFFQILKAAFFLVRTVCDRLCNVYISISNWGSNIRYTSNIDLTLNQQTAIVNSSYLFEIKCYYENAFRFWNLSSLSFERYATRLCNVYSSIWYWCSNICYTSNIDLTSNQLSAIVNSSQRFEIKYYDENSYRFWNLGSFSFER
jgi:hypothetical protein